MKQYKYNFIVSAFFIVKLSLNFCQKKVKGYKYNIL